MFALFAAAVVTALTAAAADVRATMAEATRLQQAGNLDAASEAFVRAANEAAAGSRERAVAWLALAGVESDLGRYGDAGRHANAAADVYSRLGYVAGASLAYNRAGLAALFAGAYGTAESAFGQALAAGSERVDPDGRAEQLGNLGNVHFFTGRYADAARRYDEALRLVARHATAAWAPRRRRILLVNQATLEQRLGRDESALAIYRSLEQPVDLPPSEQAQVLVNLGVLYRRLGDPLKALETYDRARALFVEDRHPDGELGALKNRGIVLALDLHRYDEAERAFTTALERASELGNRREMLHAQLYRGETRRRAGEVGAARDDFSEALRTARALKTPEETWKALYGLGRTEPDAAAAAARLDESIATIEQVRESIRIPSRRSDFLNDKREVYDARLAVSLERGAGVAAAFELLERSHSRGWRERLGLAAPVSLASVQAALPEDALLLDYWTSDAGSAVIAVTRRRADVLSIRASAGAIAATADRWSAAPGGTVRAGPAPLDLLPPPDWFAGIRHVIVVPDGALSLVPFEMLGLGGRPLVERAAISYLPSAAALLRAAPERSRWLPPWRVVLRAFGDPLVSASSLDDAGAVRGRLAATAREVRTIAAELGGRSQTHLGSEDRKATLLQAARAGAMPPLLHLATHATADAGSLEQSRILFSPPSPDVHGADYLFLREAYDLRLEGVELAVLSACETERGRLVRGEGIENFSRAFLAAGAQSTVTTLWRVEDAATADFMAVFYHQLQAGQPRDEALRQAKLRFMHSGSPLADPHYWAAFVLTGDGLRPIPRAPSWRTVTAAGTALLALVTLGLALRRARQRHV